MNRPVLHLKKKTMQRFERGHPWIFSNEVEQVPKSISNGDIAELKDHANQFLAYGFASRTSLISFRTLTRSKKSAPNGGEPSFWGERLCEAAKLRNELGLSESSHRLCFGEADGIPGLIIDRYLLNTTPMAQVFVVQAQTAGADKLMELTESILQQVAAEVYQGIAWERTAIVIKNNVEIRSLEGLSVDEPRILKSVENLDLSNVEILTRSNTLEQQVGFFTDLVHGQKTGFFLDQRGDIDLALSLINYHGRNVKVLDLCCYVGQWSKHLNLHLKRKDCQVETVGVDASEKALSFFQKNLHEFDGVQTKKADVMTDLRDLTPSSFDIVICDPPALIKSRKHIHAGERAYHKLNAEALKLLKPGGYFVSCSCSALLTEPVLLETISHASRKNSLNLKIIGRGAQASDHPMTAEFPEGSYLKCFVAKAST